MPEIKQEKAQKKITIEDLRREYNEYLSNLPVYEARTADLEIVKLLPSESANKENQIRDVLRGFLKHVLHEVKKPGLMMGHAGAGYFLSDQTIWATVYNKPNRMVQNKGTEERKPELHPIELSVKYRKDKTFADYRIELRNSDKTLVCRGISISSIEKQILEYFNSL